MKRFFFLPLMVLVISISGCSPGKLFGPTLTMTPTFTLTPTNTQTPTPTSTPTNTPTPTTTPTPIGGGLGRLAFINAEGNIYSVNIDGSGLVQLTNSNKDSSPVWSPDGNQIAFSSYRDDPDLNRDHSEIYLMESDGSNQVRLTHSNKGETTGVSSWSPDGKRIAFTLCGFNRCDNYTIKIDGTGLTRLTTSGANTSPLWSPDGEHIAYSNSSIAQGNQVYIMKSDGSNITQLTHKTGKELNGPINWSHDSKKIAYSSVIAFYEKFEKYAIYRTISEIWIMNVDGSDKTQITHVYVSNQIPQRSCKQGSWSPDDTRLVISCWLNNGGNGSIYIVNVDGKSDPVLVPIPIDGTVKDPSWHP